ncbi:MAG: ROK family protein, partial [Verrucomicrobiales bacterium]
TARLNELAFAPIDYRENAPVDEWSGDGGCGAQYFSQQAVARLAPVAGFDFSDEMPFPERLIAVQEAMKAGDEKAAKIYDTIGACFGYAVAHYADFYEIENLMTMGRVTSGEGGERLIAEAKRVLADEFPQLHEALTFCEPSEQDKRHGQAVAAASLPALA